MAGYQVVPSADGKLILLRFFRKQEDGSTFMEKEHKLTPAIAAAMGKKLFAMGEARSIDPISAQMRTSADEDELNKLDEDDFDEDDED